MEWKVVKKKDQDYQVGYRLMLVFADGTLGYASQERIVDTRAVWCVRFKEDKAYTFVNIEEINEDMPEIIGQLKPVRATIYEVTERRIYTQEVLR